MTDSTLSNENRTFNSSADLMQLRKEDGSLTSQELRDLTARIKAREDLADLEDRMRALEERERTMTPEQPYESGQSRQELSTPSDPFSASSSSGSIDSSGSDSDISSASEHPRRKRKRTATKGIKVTPDYILRVNSSLREWGDWKSEIERVFEGKPHTYRKGRQRIIKALDYVDKSLKTLWYTYRFKMSDMD
ncbi:hypothetical protein V1509DRAFT_667985 [Lipomyces kononenkoae]